MNKANKKKKKIAIVGTNGLPGKYGGWDQLVRHLTANLREEYDFYVYTSKWDADPNVSEFNGAKIKVIPLKANGVQSVIFDAVSMLFAAFRCDVIAVFGTSGCVFLPFIRLLRGKVLLNPDGAEWKRGKWGKAAKSFLHLSERVGVRYSNVVVSDNLCIQQALLDEYGAQSTLIEYGGDHALSVDLSAETKELYDLQDKKYAFKVCRIEPENNIHTILEAFEGEAAVLVIIGNWENSAYGKDLKEKYRNSRNIRILDPIYDQQRLDELRGNCGVYVHGHSVGGTNPSLVEAMSLGLCCIVFDVNYNRETTENAALYFGSREDLQSQVKHITSNKAEAEIIGARLHEVACRRYKWEEITNKYSEAFMAMS